MNPTETKNPYLPYPDGTPPHWGEEMRSNTFVPTAVQLERAEALTRFNRWAIYVPLGVLATAVVGFLIYLLILAVWPPYEDTRLFLSGVADIILILFMLPVVLLFGLLLAGIFGGAFYWRQSKKETGEPSLQNKYGRLRLLLWKLDQKLSTVYRKVDQVMPKIAQPVMRLNATLAYISSWLGQLNGRKHTNS
ncbi:MAG: hypothetical protein H6652_12665 [Ardenticatenaceae bacterium]|nr:hypothetical protein [Ardenticatenaceae bacterium]MCB8947399.1 hypothetical protein [Ardenticatenaceae bacterium]